MSALPDRYFVVGHPVAHSLSPRIHAAFALQTGQHMVYERCLCPLDGFARTVRDLAADTSGGPVRGCNVTLPFKFEAVGLATRRTPRAALAGAANTLRFDADGWLADNTDGVGLMRDLQHNEGLTIAGREVLLVGAGGAAAGLLGPLIQAAPRRIVVANRTRERADALVERHAGLASSSGVVLHGCGLDGWSARGSEPAFDVLINASTSSLSGYSLPVPEIMLAPGWCAADLMYGQAATAFLEWARARQAARAVDGLGMLVEQAAEAFMLWRGVRPATSPVLAQLRAGLAERVR